MTLFALFEAIQHRLDLGNHIICKKGWGRPQTYRDVFHALWENHVIDVSLRDQLVELAGFRNLPVHMYGKLDLEKVIRTAPISSTKHKGIWQSRGRVIGKGAWLPAVSEIVWRVGAAVTEWLAGCLDPHADVRYLVTT